MNTGHVKKHRVTYVIVLIYIHRKYSQNIKEETANTILIWGAIYKTFSIGTFSIDTIEEYSLVDSQMFLFSKTLTKNSKVQTGREY